MYSISTNKRLIQTMLFSYTDDSNVHPVIKYTPGFIIIGLVIVGIFILLFHQSAQYAEENDYFSKEKGQRDKEPPFLPISRWTTREGFEPGAKTACGVECGKFVEVQDKMNALSKIINEIKQQDISIKENEVALKQLSDRVKNAATSKTNGKPSFSSDSMK